MRIIVAVDGSESSRQALSWGLDEGRARGCPVVALLAYGFYGRPKQVQERASGFDDDELFEVAQDLLHAVVAEVTATLDPRGLPDVQMIAAGTEPADALLDFAGAEDVLVLGTREMGPIGRLLIGSTGLACARASACPVVVVRDHAREPERRSVVVGIDGSPSSIAALDWATGHAVAHDLPLHVIRAWPPPAGTAAGFDGYTAKKLRAQTETELVALADRHRPASTLQEKVELVDGSAGRVLIDAAADAGLLVLGSSDVAGFPRSYLGSTGSTCLTHARSSVAVVHPPGDASAESALAECALAESALADGART